MEGIYKLKNTFERLYKNWGSYLEALGKFLIAFLLFHQINGRMGALAVLDNIFAELILALFCSFLPMNTAVVISSILILGHLYALSIPALVVGGSVLLIVLLLYFSFAKSEAYAFLLTMLALMLHIPCSIPLIFGLLGTPLSGAGIAGGTVIYYTISVLKEMGGSGAALALAGSAGEEAIIDTIRALMDTVLAEQEMILMLIVLLAVFAVVYFSRKLAMKYAWTVAIGAGTLIYLVITLAGCLMLEMRMGILEILVGTLISLLIAAVLELLFFHLDYKKTESLQFEDDEYYYYVKAVPKKNSGKKQKMLNKKGSEADNDIFYS